MMHQHTPCMREHEIVCCTCAQVLEDVPEMPSLFDMNRSLPNYAIVENHDTVFSGLEKMMLPLSINNKVGYWQDNFDKPVLNYFRVLDRLKIIVTEELHLPKYYAFETMRRLLRKRKGMYSYRLQLLELIQVLQTTNDNRLQVHIISLNQRVQNAKGI